MSPSGHSVVVHPNSLAILLSGMVKSSGLMAAPSLSVSTRSTAFASYPSSFNVAEYKSLSFPVSRILHSGVLGAGISNSLEEASDLRYSLVPVPFEDSGDA